MTETLQRDLIAQIEATSDVKLLEKLQRTIADYGVELKRAKKRKAADDERNKKEAKRRAAVEAKLAVVQEGLDKFPYQIEALENGYELSFNMRSWEDPVDEEEDAKIDAFINWLSRNVADVVDGDAGEVTLARVESPEALIASIERCKNPEWLAVLRRH